MSKETFIVTGAGGVIGAQVATRLADRDVHLILTDVSGASLETLRDSLAKLSLDDPMTIAFEVGDLNDVGFAEQLVGVASRDGGILGGCINIAGIDRPVSRVSALSLDEMRMTFEVNVFALMQLSQLVIRQLLNQSHGGRIVNMASGAGLSGAPFMTAYNSSKHAVLGITRCLAKELARDGIAVNAVCPGYVRSRMVSNILDDIEELSGEQFDPIPTIPAGRMAEPDEIANVVEYLALDSPIYLTGTALLVDGGLYA